MRHPAFLLLAAATLAAPAAQAETRVIAQTNGWTAFDGTTERGMPTCGLETRDPNTGRHFLLQQVIGQDRPILRLSRPSWSLGPPASRTVRIVIDRRVFAANATGAGQELSWPASLDAFEPAFRQGRIMRVEFPAGPDAPWNLSLTGTNAVMGAFMGCLRMLAIQPPGVAPPAESQPIQPPPAAEPPPLAPSPLTPPPEEPLRPPVEAPPQPQPEPPPPAAPPATAPRFGMPPDKPGPTVPDGKAPGAKPGLRSSPVPL